MSNIKSLLLFPKPFYLSPPQFNQLDCILPGVQASVIPDSSFLHILCTIHQKRLHGHTFKILLTAHIFFYHLLLSHCTNIPSKNLQYCNNFPASPVASVKSFLITAITVIILWCNSNLGTLRFKMVQWLSLSLSKCHAHNIAWKAIWSGPAPSLISFTTVPITHSILATLATFYSNMWVLYILAFSWIHRSLSRPLFWRLLLHKKLFHQCSHALHPHLLHFQLSFFDHII